MLVCSKGHKWKHRIALVWAEGVISGETYQPMGTQAIEKKPFNEVNLASSRAKIG
jgi:hypothetical protein